MLACQVREDMVRTLPPTCDSAVLPCVHGSLAFLHRHIPPQSPSHPLHPSLHSRQQPSPCNCSTIPKLQLPATAPSRSKDCLILISFRLPQISCFTLSLKCFSSDLDSCSCVGIGSLLQFPTAMGRSSPTNSPVFPPSSFILSSFVWFWYSFPLVRYSCLLSAGILHALLWRCISDLLWKEMYSASTYSSAILF